VAALKQINNKKTAAFGLLQSSGRKRHYFSFGYFSLKEK